MKTHTNPDKAVTFARFVVEGARINHEHIGERLMDSLKAPVAAEVRESDFSPKFQEMDYDDVCQWVNDHLVFDSEGAQVALVNGQKVLWEADKNG